MERFGIICAMKEEAQYIINEYNLKKDHGIYRGQILNKEVGLIISGIGKTETSISTFEMTLSGYFTHIINIGVAASLNDRCVLNHAYVIKTVNQHDFYLPEYLNHPKNISSQDIHLLGTSKQLLTGDQFIDETNNELLETSKQLLTGDQFIDETNNDLLKQYIDTYDLIDMEGYVFARICQHLNKKCCLIKSVSDIIFTKNQQDNILKTMNTAMNNALTVLEDAIHRPIVYFNAI